MNAEQMLEIARLRLQGMSLDEIALELGCTRQQVAKGMNKLIRYLRRNRLTRTKVIYPNILRAMQLKCMSVQEVEDAAGLDKVTVYNIITGKTRMPRMYTAQMIADALGLTVREAFAREESGSARTAQA